MSAPPKAGTASPCHPQLQAWLVRAQLPPTPRRSKLPLAQLAQALSAALEGWRGALGPLTAGSGAPDCPRPLVRRAAERQLRLALVRDVADKPRPWPDLAQAFRRAGLQGSVAPGDPIALPPAPEARRGQDLALEFATPLVLPCPWRDFDLSRLQAMVIDRLRVCGLRPPTSGAVTAEALLPHLARHAAASAEAKPQVRTQVAGLGAAPYGHLLGTVFVRDPSPALLHALHMLSALHLAPAGPAARIDWRGGFTLKWLQHPWLDRGLLNRRRAVAIFRKLAIAQGDTALVDERGVPTSATAAAERMLDLVRRRAWCPAPSQILTLHHEGRPLRWVEQLSPIDLGLQQHLLDLLAPVFDRRFRPASMAYRPGLGREAALLATRSALREGFTQVARTDIKACFDSIDQAGLLTLVEQWLPATDQLLRAALRAALAQPMRVDGAIRKRTSGVTQGAPLSPLLANVMLTPLDQALEALPVRCVRYADDILILARSPAQARDALTLCRAAARSLGFELADAKTGLSSLQRGFTFLGESFHPGAVEALPPATAAQRKPLVVTWPYVTLGVNGPCVEARRQGVLLGQWPLRRLSGLLLLARASLSTTLIERCIRQGVTLVASAEGGRDAVVLAADRPQALRRLARHQQWHDTLPRGEKLALAQAVLLAKLHNSQALVTQRDPRAALIAQLAEVSRRAGQAGSTAVLRGLEGQAARQVFAWLQGQISPRQAAAFTARRRERGAPDRLNSVLNFCYHLLRMRVHTMLRLHALNPYLGWLHDDDDAYETLAYDLMEPLRAFVDRFVLRTINRLELGGNDFGRADEPFRLKPASAAKVANSFERMLGERVGAHALRDLLWAQVRSVAALVEGEGGLWLVPWNVRDHTPLPALADDSGPWTLAEGDHPAGTGDDNDPAVAGDPSAGHADHYGRPSAPAGRPDGENPDHGA